MTNEIDYRIDDGDGMDGSDIWFKHVLVDDDIDLFQLIQMSYIFIVVEDDQQAVQQWYHAAY